jgi:hypothetical protein
MFEAREILRKGVEVDRFQQLGINPVQRFYESNLVSREQWNLTPLSKPIFHHGCQKYCFGQRSFSYPGLGHWIKMHLTGSKCISKKYLWKIEGTLKEAWSYTFPL